MLARCPNCRNTFSTERSGRQDCPSCGKPLVVPEQAVPVLATTDTPVSNDGTPWEHRRELGTLRAWSQTMQQALLEPAKLFASARLDHGSDHLSFAVWTTAIFWAIGQILERAMLSGQNEMYRRMLGGLTDNPDLSPMLRKMIDAGSAGNSWPWTIGLALLTPVFAYIFIYVNAAVTHGFALLLGQSKRGFPATFAACAYSCAPLVLVAVPACGSIVGVIWLVVLTGIGLKETHRISTGGAAATVLTPYIAFCCLIAIASAFVAMALRNVMTGTHP
jgi:hypothetical protein